jgi:hypothetical protein
VLEYLEVKGCNPYYLYSNGPSTDKDKANITKVLKKLNLGVGTQVMMTFFQFSLCLKILQIKS